MSDLSEKVEDEDAEEGVAASKTRRDTSARRFKIVIFGLLLFAAALTLAGAMRFWLAPGTPITLFLILGVCPVFFWTLLGAFVFDPRKTSDAIVKSSGSPPLRERLRMSLVPVMVSALVTGVLVATWLIPGVRGAWASALGSQRFVAAVEGALFDPNADVRLTACEALAAANVDSLNLAISLQDVDDRVVTCALNAMPTYSVAPPPLAAMSMTWSAELLDGEEISGDRACMLSDRLRVANRKGFNRGAVQLMTCALDSTQPAARECCAQSFRALLGGQDVEPAMVMPPPEELARSGFLATVPSLLKATHSDDPHWDSRRIAMQLGTPSSRAWAMRLACDALGMGAERAADMSAAMADAVSSESCQIEPATETTIRLWTAVCDELYTPERIMDARGEESDIFCQAIAGTLVVDASTSARQAVQRAIRRGKSPDARRDMMRALLSYGTKMASTVLDDDANPLALLTGQTQAPSAKSGAAPAQPQMFESLFNVAAGAAGLDDSTSMTDMMEMMMGVMTDGEFDLPKSGARQKGRQTKSTYHQQFIQKSLEAAETHDGADLD